MVKATKSCQLVVQLLNGKRLAGRFHVEASTSSAVRPSDALRQESTGYLLMTHAYFEGECETDAPDRVILVNRAAVGLIELSQNNWRS